MNKEMLKYLTKKEHVDLIILSHRFLSCRNKTDFTRVILDLKNLFNHDNAVLAYGNIKEVLSNPEPRVDLLNISFPQSFLDYYFKNGPVSDLTLREIEVLNWIKEGKSSWEISMILNCSKRSVDFHVNNLKKKLNAVNRPQAVAIGLYQGIIRF